MAYNNLHKNGENLDRHLKIDDRLDSHLKPIKIGEDISALEISSDDVKVSGKLDVYGDLDVKGNVYSQSIQKDISAGMILGYTRIQNDGTTSADANITIPTGGMTPLITAQGTYLSINFKVPPSGNVEIQCSFWMAGASDGAKFSLSTGTSYVELDETHTYDADQTVYIDESDHNYNTVSFSVTGLTAGFDRTYYLAGLASGAGVFMAHGRNRTGGTHYPPIILKAIALPAIITTGE